jgi:amidase
MNDYADLDATALAQRVRAGEVQALELVELAIAAIEKVDPRLNAVVHRMYDRARAQARAGLPAGPFQGVPFVVKDLDGFLAGEPYTAACRQLASFVPDHDAAVIARMRATGVVVLAKANCPELGILAVTEPELHGATRNPWDPERTPCGSSGGSAALVAARAVPMAHGGDGGGSIRIPASACGLFGLKPTRGRVPIGPDHGEGWGGYVQQHVLTRSVRDSAAMLDAIAGAEPGAPYAAPTRARPFLDELTQVPGHLRVAFSLGSLFGRDVQPDCTEAVRRAARLCEELGHEVEEAAPEIDRHELVRAYFTQIAVSVAAGIAEAERLSGRRATPAGFEASTWMLGQIGRMITALELDAAREACHRAGRRMASFHERYDVFLNATLADVPARIGELALKPIERAGLRVLRALPSRTIFDKLLFDLGERNLERTPNTMLFNQTGQPAMSVPLHQNAAGLPIGVQFAARFGDEATLLRLAAQLEQAQPWVGRRPPICA